MTVARIVGRGRRARALVLRGSEARWYRAEVRGKLIVVWISETRKS